MTTRPDFHCLICPPGTFRPNALRRDATDRERIAALCDHVMAVHNGGPTDAWEQASLAYPRAAQAWVEELYPEHQPPTPPLSVSEG